MFESILFVGDLSHQWSRSRARLDALRAQLPNAKIDEVNWNKNSCIGSFIVKAYFKLNNRALAPFYFLPFYKLKSVDLLWIDNIAIFPPGFLPTIKKIFKDLTVIFVSEDNFMLPHNHRDLHKGLISHYHCVFTTKPYVMKKLTAEKHIRRIHDSYDDRLTKKSSQKNIPYQYDVSFVGTFEQSRFEYLLHIAERGIQVDIFGNVWPPSLFNDNLRIHPPAYGPAFREVVQLSKINLIFFRHINFDEITSRSYEVPAFEAFFLAERSPAHIRLYCDDRILFSSKADLARKVSFWLNAGERARAKSISTQSPGIIRAENSISSQVNQILKKSSWASRA